MSRIIALLIREWSDVIRNRILIIGMLLPACIFLVIPLGLAIMLPQLGDPSKAEEMENIMRLFEGREQLTGLSPELLFQIYVLQQFIILFLIVPIVSSLSIATYSIVGEKDNRTLEPLLATPIRTSELMIGKTLAATLPAIGILWLLVALYALAIRLLLPPVVFDNVFTKLILGLIFLIGPLIAVLGLAVGVIMSARSSDARSAQQIGAVLILPVMALFVSQIMGISLLSGTVFLVAVLVLVLLDFITLKAGIALFHRETILTRWK